MAETTQRRRGTIYTFYSYKGGVGRSMALANVASLLAKWDFRCLIVDWDLEAPGIERYFEAAPSRLSGSPAKVPGLLDLIRAREEGRSLDWHKCLVQAQPFPSGQPIDILPAGRRSETYTQSVQKLDWKSLFEEHDIGGYLEDLREEWARSYDFVLVDSRTGISDIGSICTVLLPDVLVLLFTTNEQSLAGVIEVAHAAREARDELPVDRSRLVAVPVPARDESQNEYEKSQEWKEIFAERLRDLYEDWIPKDATPKEVLKKLYIPYITIWSFGERLPVVERQEELDDPRSISAAYARLGALLAYQLDWSQIRGSHSTSEAVRAREAIAEQRQLAKRARRRTRLVAVAAAVVTLALTVVGSLWERSHRETRRIEDIVSVARSAGDPTVTALLLSGLANRNERIELWSTLLRHSLPIPAVLLRDKSWKISNPSFGVSDSLIAGICTDGALRVWFADGTGRPTVFPLEKDPPETVAWEPGGDHLLMMTRQGSILLAGWAGPEVEIRNTSKAVAADFGPTGNVLAVYEDGSVIEWRPHGRRAFPASASLAVRRNAFAGRVLKQGPALDSAFFNQNRTQILGIGRDGKMRVESLTVKNGGRPPFSLPDEKVTAVAQSADGSVVAAILEKGGVGLWAPGRELRADRPVSGIALSPDGDMLAMGLPNGVVELRSIPEGRKLRVLFENSAAVTGIVFSPDGQHLAVASQDGEVRVWAIASEGSILVLRGHEAGVTAMSFSRDGYRLWTLSGGGAVRIWRLSSPAPPFSLTADQLARFVQKSTSICLTVEQRVQMLAESLKVASVDFQECERDHGRGPGSLQPSLLSRLKRYKIYVFFLQGPGAQKRADHVMILLKELGLKAQIALEPRPKAFFDDVLPPLNNEVRYQIPEEVDARLLAAMLNYGDANLDLKLREAPRTLTSGILSIFLSLDDAPLRQGG